MYVLSPLYALHHLPQDSHTQLHDHLFQFLHTSAMNFQINNINNKKGKKD